MKRIICVGNRYVDSDDAGVRVFDRLAGQALPDGVEIVDGGIAGLNLLGLIDGAERVVFVDAVSGFAAGGEVVVLSAEDVPRPVSAGLDHAAGLPYLFSVVPNVCEGIVPDLYIVGIEGLADDRVIGEAARMSIQIASQGWHQRAAANSPSGGKHGYAN